MNDNLEDKSWWSYVHHDVKELLCTSELLIRKVAKWEEKFHDYSFIVFPAAKAYEGFLKTIFLELGFISEEKYSGKRFRIGKALNPALEGDLRKREGVYDKIVKYCGGKGLADNLWDTWKTCRNQLFHWFPNEKNVISFAEAKERVGKVIETIDLVFEECKIK